MTPPTTEPRGEAERRELLALLEKATPGPWRIDNDFLISLAVGRDGAAIADLRYFHCPDHEANAALIVAAVNALPRLLATPTGSVEGGEAKKPVRHRVWFEPLPDGDFPLQGGWLTGRNNRRHQSIGMNEPIYCRGDEDEAIELRTDEAVRLIHDYRFKGYPCRAVPPITVIY